MLIMMMVIMMMVLMMVMTVMILEVMMVKKAYLVSLVFNRRICKELIWIELLISSKCFSKYSVDGLISIHSPVGGINVKFGLHFPVCSKIRVPLCSILIQNSASPDANQPTSALHQCWKYQNVKQYLKNIPSAFFCYKPPTNYLHHCHTAEIQ